MREWVNVAPMCVGGGVFTFGHHHIVDLFACIPGGQIFWPSLRLSWVTVIKVCIRRGLILACVGLRENGTNGTLARGGVILPVAL